MHACRTLFDWLLELMNDVVDHAGENFMNPANLGIVMGPNLLPNVDAANPMQALMLNKVCLFACARVAWPPGPWHGLAWVSWVGLPAKVARLAGWLAEWLAGGVVGSLDGWLARCMGGWLVAWEVGSLDGWYACLLAGRLFDWLSDCLRSCLLKGTPMQCLRCHAKCAPTPRFAAGMHHFLNDTDQGPQIRRGARLAYMMASKGELNGQARRQPGP